MDRCVRAISLVLLFMGIACAAHAQQSAGASISATVVTPIGIEKDGDLDFGNIAAGYSSGAVVLKPDGSRVQSGGAGLPSLTGNVAPAKFHITGAANSTYSISLPTASHIISNGNDNMTVLAFTSDPPMTGTIGPGGVAELNVGATVQVGAQQPQGTYASLADFLVTVNYN